MREAVYCNLPPCLDAIGQLWGTGKFLLTLVTFRA